MRAVAPRPRLVSRATHRPITVADVLSHHRPRPAEAFTFAELAESFLAQARADWGQTTLLRRWHEVLERAGVAHPATGPRRLHAARHTFASLLVRAGAAGRSVRAITHDSTADGSTFARYVHLDWSSLCEAVLKLEI